MEKKDLYFNPEPIDPRTDYGKGLGPKIDPITPYGKGLEPKIDPITPYGKGLEPKIEPRTDYGKGISYKTCDGRDVATMEEVMLYNQMFYDRMMKKVEDHAIENKGMHR